MILFVGINNKKDKKPLQTGTKTGNIIDMISEYFQEHVILKTNLCNFEIEGKFPNKSEIILGKEKIKKLIKEEKPNVIVCLGNLVFENCKEFKNAIKIKHPGYILRNGKSINQYVKESVAFIQEERNERRKIKKNKNKKRHLKGQYQTENF